MINYLPIIELIESHHESVDFRDYGDGASIDWIRKAQERLRVVFPPSYVWWLKTYGGGEIYGEEIFSIYEMDFDTVVGGDVVYMNELYRKKGYSNQHLIISTTDRGEVYYFNLDIKDSDGENPIFVNVINDIYASNFIEFLRKRIIIQ